MHHHKTYLYINFQQNRVKTQVMTVLTSLFAKESQINLQLPINIFSKIDSFRHASSLNVHVHIFSKMGLVDQPKPCTHLFAENFKLHKFATCNQNFEKPSLSDMDIHGF